MMLPTTCHGAFLHFLRLFFVFFGSLLTRARTNLSSWRQPPLDMEFWGDQGRRASDLAFSGSEAEACFWRYFVSHGISSHSYAAVLSGTLLDTYMTLVFVSFYLCLAVGCSTAGAASPWHTRRRALVGKEMEEREFKGLELRGCLCIIISWRRCKCYFESC